MLALLKDLRRYSQASVTLFAVSVKSTVASVRLGWLWWFLDPLIMMAIYYFVVRVVFQRGGENYHLFVLCGIVAWGIFARSLSAAVTAISKNRGIIRQTSTPMGLLIAVPCAVRFFFTSVGMLIVMCWSYATLGVQSLAVFRLLLLVFFIAYAVSLFVAVTQVFLADTAKLVAYGIRAGFFLSPVLYPTCRVLDADNIPAFAKHPHWLDYRGVPPGDSRRRNVRLAAVRGAVGAGVASCAGGAALSAALWQSSRESALGVYMARFVLTLHSGFDNKSAIGAFDSEQGLQYLQIEDLSRSPTCSR